MDCPSCRADNPQGNRYCTRCGSALPLDCAACGRSNPPGSRFCGGCGTPFDMRAAPAAPTRDGGVGVERRQLTVMFCDLVGSTSLSERLDLEKFRDVIRSFYSSCVGVIAQRGGFIARSMGDGVLAYFGFPYAHEDDAVEAIRAGLAVVHAVGGLDSGDGAALQARVGIATGLVVVGDETVGASQREVVGEAPNLAARLQSIAEPGQVLIAGDTRRLAGRYFEYRDLGQVSLKGFSTPVQAWQVARASSVASRFEARQTAGMLPLIGRERELEMLLEKWQSARRGNGQVVVLTGEAGIGKSRLAAELQDRIQSEPHIRLRYFCSPHHSDSAWFPIIGQLERACRFEHTDTAEQKLPKIEELVRLSGAMAHPDQVPLMADLLSVPTGGRYALPPMVPQQRKQRTAAALLAQLRGLAAAQPVLIVFEDAHWSDPTTLEVMARTIAILRPLRALLLITARPEFVAPWPDYDHVSSFPLRRLSRPEAATVVGLVAGKSMPPSITEQIVARTEGVPLFVEELTKTVLESGALQEHDDRYERDALLPSSFALPPTVQESIMARLDRLAPVKELAQIGAALGRRFTYRMVKAVIDLPDAQLRRELARLSEAEIIFQRGIVPDTIYTFKHALVQDAAYGSMLRSTRQALHRRIVLAIESEFREIAETEPEVLAEHCSRCEMHDKAVDHWIKAGERSVARSANQEAIRHLQKGLAQLAQLPDDDERARRELRLQLTLGQACIAIYGYTGEQTSQAYARARELMDFGDLDQRVRVLFGLYIGDLLGGELETAAVPVRQMFDLVMPRTNTGYICLAYRVDGVVALYNGDLARARSHLQKAIDLYDEKQHGDLAFRFGSNLGISAQAWLVVALWLLGQPDAARRLAEETAAAARSNGHVHTVGHVLALVTHIYAETNNFPMLDQITAEGVRYCDDNSLGFFGAWLRVMRVWATAQLGTPGDHIAGMREALDRYAKTRATLMRPYFRGLLARLLLAAGRVDDAEAEAETALRDGAATGEHWWDAELHRLRGLCHLARAQPDLEGAEACFRGAIAKANARGARMLEVRAVNSLAELLRRQGRAAEARSLLGPVYRQFREGFSTPDLQTARALSAD